MTESKERRVTGAVSRVGPAYCVHVPSDVLDSEYSARPVRVRSTDGASCRARVYRRTSGEVALLLRADRWQALGLSAGAKEVTLHLRVQPEHLRASLPFDLAEGLLLKEVDWDELPERDRRWMISLVLEARTPTLRAARIQRIVNALGSVR